MSGNEGRATHHKEESESEVARMMNMRGCDHAARVSESESRRRMRRSSGEGENAAGNMMRRMSSSSSSRGSESVMNVTKPTGGENAMRFSRESETGVKMTDVTESKVRSREGEDKITDRYENEVNMRRDKERESERRVMADMNGSAIGAVTAAGTEGREGRLATDTTSNINATTCLTGVDVGDSKVSDDDDDDDEDDASDEPSESGLSEGSGSEARALTRRLSSTVVKELQAAILSPNPSEVRSLLDRHPHALNTQPSGDEEWWPLHLLAKVGEDYNAPALQSNSTCLALQAGKADDPLLVDDDSTDTITTITTTIITTTTPTTITTTASTTPPHPPWVWSRDAEEERRHRARMTVVHMLVDAGVDVNARDASGLTPLHYAARRGDAAICDALVQCGADLDARHCGVTVYEEVAEAAQAEVEAGGGGGGGGRLKELTPSPSDDLADPGPLTNTHRNQDHSAGGPVDRYRAQDRGSTRRYGAASLVYRVLRFYWPGLWRAVATQDINKVRQLVNSWCRVELVKGGVSLRELAASTGNEAIISLLVNILPSMSLVHHTLAGNALAVQELLESPARKKINIDIRKLSERGAPLLFFPIRAGHVKVVRELRRHGASLYTQMLDDDMVDVPVIFSALEPWMEPEVIKSLLPAANSIEARLLERVWHRGKNILRQAVERGVHIEAIEAILEVGGAALLSERDPAGQTTLDYCLSHDLTSLVALFDLHVAAWLTRPDLYPARRDLLAVRGYGRLEEVGTRQVNLGQDVALFLQEYRRCQGVLGEMFAAIREGEGSRLHSLLQYHSHLFHLVDLLWQGRLEGDGMTLLHWAVLHGREGTVGLILRAPHTQTTPDNTPSPPTLTTRFSVDDIRDGWGRTPLHYAAGLVEGRGIEAALLHHGCSEHTLDMDGREPLDFKDARGSPALAMLLHNLRNKNHSSPQPDPWDPDTLRAHLERLRRQRFTSHHHHHHHHQHQHHQGSPTITPYGRHALKTGPPYPYPAHFPTSPGSNFHWPLPRQLFPPDRDEEDEKGGHRMCCIM